MLKWRRCGLHSQQSYPERGAAALCLVTGYIHQLVSAAVFADGVIMSRAILSVIAPPDGLSCLLPTPNIAIAATKYKVEVRAAHLKGKLMVSVIL